MLRTVRITHVIIFITQTQLFYIIFFYYLNFLYSYDKLYNSLLKKRKKKEKTAIFNIIQHLEHGSANNVIINLL